MQLFVITDILEQEYMFKGGRCGTSWLVLKANIFRTLLVMAAVLVAVCCYSHTVILHENLAFNAGARSGLYPTSAP